MAETSVDRRQLEIEVELLRRGITPESLQPEQQPEQQEDLGIATRAAQGFNVGLAKGLGAPVDLVNAALSFVGLGSEQPVGGSAFLQRGLAGAGAAPEPGTEREELGQVGRITEEVGATVIPGGVVGGAARAGRTGGQILKPVFDFFKQRPGTFAATEVAGATTAGIGAALANQAFPGNDLADMAGQLAGGLVTPQALIAERGPQAINQIRRAIKVLFTKEGAKDIAGQIVQKSVRDKERAIEGLSRDSDFAPGSQVTATAETGDAGLLALEKAAIKKSQELKDGIAEAMTATNKAITDELKNLRGTGSIEATTVQLQDRVDYLTDLMGIRSQQAVKAATDRLSKLPPNIPREQANIIVRKELDSAFDAGRAQEKELWEAVPKNAQATVENARGKLANILRKRDPKIDNPDDIPQWLRRLFSGKGGIKGEQSLGRVQKIRSRVLTEMRAENGKEVPNRNKVRILGEMADSLLDDMSVAASDEVSLARAFSKDFNERFTQGTVGDILGFSKTGELAVPPALTLEKTLGAQGPAGGVAIDELTRAVGVQVSPEDTGFEVATNAIRDFVADRFVRKFPDNQINPTTAKRFLSENAQVLARNPELKAEIEDALKSQEAAEAFLRREKIGTRNLHDKNKIAASVLLDAPADREIKRILSSKNPAKNMSAIVKRAVKDKTGESLSGLRAALLDEVFSSGLRGGRDLDQREILSGDAMAKFVKANQRAISSVLSSEQMKRLNRVVRTATVSQRRAAAGFPGEAIIDESPDMFTDLVLSVIGANIGGSSALGQASGAPLVIAGRAAETARNFGRKFISRIPAGRITQVIDQAILDRDLMNELLKRPKTLEQAVEHQRALRGFLINLVPEAFTDEPLTIEITQDARDLERAESGN